METNSLAEIKRELQSLSDKDLLEIVLRLAKFKKANKELTHYLLFESFDEAQYIEKAKEEIRLRFKEMPRNSLFFSTKYIRKTLRIAKQYAQYSKLVQTETELLLFFCEELHACKGYWAHYKAIEGIYAAQVEKIKKNISKLHEDLQYDYGRLLEKL